MKFDFNTEETELCLSEFSISYDFQSLVKDKSCFKNPENRTCVDLFIKNTIGSFLNATAVASELSFFIKW